MNLIYGIKILSVLLCSLGLLYQVEQISERYFKFQSRSDIHLSIPENTTMPRISTCWYLKSVMKGMEEKSVEEFYNKLDTMTVEEIFNSVPPVENIMKEEEGCAIRKPSQFISIYPNRSECLKLFFIKRYIQRNFICYKFYVKNMEEENLEITEYSLTPSSPGLIYRIVMNETPFANVPYFSAYAHSLSSSDLLDSMYAQSVFQYRDNASKYSHINIKVTYNSISITKLKPPYDTACRHYTPFYNGWEYVYEKLKNEMIEKLGRIHTFYPESNQTRKDKIISSQVLKNVSFLKKFNEIYQSCDKTIHDCHLEYLVSKFTLSFGPDVVIYVNWPQDSHIGMRSVPFYDLIDYLLYVCSSFGIWFGVSMFTIGDVVIKMIEKCKTAAVAKSEKNEVEMLKRSHKRLHRSFVALVEYINIQRDLMRSEFLSNQN